MTHQTNKFITILGIETSCDETSAAIYRSGKILANQTSVQLIHSRHGGVVPELASRAHQVMIVPAVQAALDEASLGIGDIDLIAFTNGPGLMGSLLVGNSFARGMSAALEIPAIPVNHMQAHILAHLIQDPERISNPEFPFLCLTVSGGHTQLVKVNSPLEFELLGETMDDAAGEAFDKAAKLLGLPYPGGPLVDKLASEGNGEAFRFARPKVPGLNFSFSGLKTSILYFLKEQSGRDADFIDKNLKDLCASIQHTIVEILLDKLKMAVETTGIRRVAISGGVSANKGLRSRLALLAGEKNWQIFILPLEYCTDNAAMIATAGYYLFSAGKTGESDKAPDARMKI